MTKADAIRKLDSAMLTMKRYVALKLEVDDFPDAITGLGDLMELRAQRDAVLMEYHPEPARPSPKKGRARRKATPPVDVAEVPAEPPKTP